MRCIRGTIQVCHWVSCQPVRDCIFFQMALLEFLWLSFFQRKSCNWYMCHCMILYHPMIIGARHGWLLSEEYVDIYIFTWLYYSTNIYIFSPGCILRAQTASPSHWWPVRCFLEEPEELTDLLWPTFAEPRPTFWVPTIYHVITANDYNITWGDPQKVNT